MILASQSPRRKELLSKVTGHFTIAPANIDETVDINETPKHYVERMAKNKAEKIKELYPDEVIIGCDTTVVLGDTILGKPIDDQDAYVMLSSLSGKTHQVMTAVCVITPENVYEHTEIVDVVFYELEDGHIKQYVKSGEASDKAGAYGIQDQGSLFVKSISGDYFSVVGLPIGYLNQLFTELGR